MNRLALATLLVLATAGSALAGAPRKKAPERRAEPAPRTKPAKNYDFTGDQIDGDRNLPDGTTVFGLPDAKRPSLIRLRGDFVREIARSAEQL